MPIYIKAFIRKNSQTIRSAGTYPIENQTNQITEQSDTQASSLGGFANYMLAFVVLTVATAYLYAAFNLPHLDVEDPIGPRLFPKIVGVVAVIAGLLLLAETFSRQRSRLTTPPRAKMPNEHKPMAVLSVLGWTLGFYLLMDSVGYLISSSVFLLGLTAFFNRGHWPVNIAVSLLFTLAVYTTFTKFLGIQLPWGILFF